MASSSKDFKVGPRFHDYLNGLREEIEHQSATSAKSLRANRFSIYLQGLSCEFELAASEVVSLRRERDEYKAKVEAQAKEIQLEDVRHNVLCRRCGRETMSAPQPAVQATASSNIAPSSTAPTSISQPQSNALRGVTPTQKTTVHAGISTQSTASSQKRTRLDSIDRYRDRAGTRLSGASASRVKFNNEVEKKLDVEMAHELFHKKAIQYVKFSQDGKYLAVGCLDGKAYIYHVETGAVIRILRNLLTKNDMITAVCFSGDTKYLATGLSDGSIYLWEINLKFVRNSFKGHTNTIVSLCFSPNGRLLASASHDSSVRLWNLRDGVAKLLIEDRPTFIDNPYYSSAVFSPDGKYVAASHRDGVVRIWDISTGRLMRRIKAHADSVEDVAFMPDGSGLCSGSETLKYWAVHNLEGTRFSQTKSDFIKEEVEELARPEREFVGHQRMVRCLAITPDGRWVASCSDDTSVRLWNSQNAQMQCILEHDHSVWTVDVSPAGYHLASGGFDNVVRIWKYSYVG